MKKDKEKTYIEGEVIDRVLEAVEAERIKMFTLLNYVLNKNSHPLQEGGMNWDKLLLDLEELEHYLAE
jgi:hypothetical protein